jgi:hypothetical protein
MKVFLSPSTKDKQFVQSLADELKHEQIEPWLCEVDIEYGDNFVAKIEEGLREADLTVPLLPKPQVRRRSVAESIKQRSGGSVHQYIEPSARSSDARSQPEPHPARAHPISIPRDLNMVRFAFRRSPEASFESAQYHFDP